MRLKAYKNGECRGSWRWPEPEGQYGLRSCYCGGREHFHKVYSGTVICQFCGRRTGVGKQGFMHRHERMVGEPRGRSWP